MTRDIDVAVLGATGVTGRRVVAYLASRARDTNARWVAAGRDPDKVRRVLAEEGVHEAEVLTADIARAESVRALSERARVVLNLVGPYAPVAEIVKRARARNWRPQFLTVSFVGTDEFIKQAGSDAEGTIITQVVPPYYLTDLPTVALYRRVLGQYFPNSQPSFVSLEGFVDAMVLVEGLRRAGKDLTREKFIRGIESIHNFDVGLGPTLKLNYGPTDHKGFDTVYATIVIGGKPVTITDWHHIKR